VRPARDWAFALIVLGLSATAPADASAGSGDSTFTPQTSLQAEMYGKDEHFYSLNLDRRMTQSAALRFGFGLWGPGEIYGVPVSASALIGSGDLCVELGVGGLYLLGTEMTDIGSNLLVTSFGGVRYQPRNGGMFLRAGVGPIYGGGNWEVWPAVSLGYSF